MITANFARVVAFVSSQGLARKRELTEDTRLLEDLHLDGDDAVDFFTSFQENFRVDLSSLDLRKYFNPEGFDPISGIANLIARLVKGEKRKRYPSLTLHDLAIALENGRWIDPKIDKRLK